MFRRRRTAEPPPVVIGSLDGFANGHLHGWICDFLHQGENAYVEVHRRGTMLMRVPAASKLLIVPSSPPARPMVQAPWRTRHEAGEAILAGSGLRRELRDTRFRSSRARGRLDPQRSSRGAHVGV